MGKRQKKHYPLSRRMVQHHVMPIVVWIFALGCVSVLFLQQTQQVQVLGIAQGVRHNVSATSTGRVRSVEVHLYDTVEQGQTLITIDTLTEEQRIMNQQERKELESERETLRTTIDFLYAQRLVREEELVDQVIRSQADRAGQERIFSVGVETARMQVLDLERQLASERTALARVQDEVTTLRLLVEENAVAPFELEQAEQRQQRLEQLIETFVTIQAEAQQNLVEAKERQQSFLELPDSPLTVDNRSIVSFAQRMRTVTEKEIAMQQQRIAEIEQRLENLNQAHTVSLKAPFSGIVSQVHLGPADVVDVNVPVLTLSAEVATEVLAYIPESQVDSIKSGMQVTIMKSGNPIKVLKGCNVVAISPTIQQLPRQLWPHPNFPQWGRAFLIQVPQELQLLAGEKVGIRTL